MLWMLEYPLVIDAITAIGPLSNIVPWTLSIPLGTQKGPPHTFMRPTIRPSITIMAMGIQILATYIRRIPQVTMVGMAVAGPDAEVGTETIVVTVDGIDAKRDARVACGTGPQPPAAMKI